MKIRATIAALMLLGAVLVSQPAAAQDDTYTLSDTDGCATFVYERALRVSVDDCGTDVQLESLYMGPLSPIGPDVSVSRTRSCTVASPTTYEEDNGKVIVVDFTAVGDCDLTIRDSSHNDNNNLGWTRDGDRYQLRTPTGLSYDLSSEFGNRFCNGSEWWVSDRAVVDMTAVFKLDAELVGGRCELTSSEYTTILPKLLLPTPSPAITSDLVYTSISPTEQMLEFTTNTCTGVSYGLETSRPGPGPGDPIGVAGHQAGYPVSDQCWTEHQVRFGNPSWGMEPLEPDTLYLLIITLTDEYGRNVLAVYRDGFRTAPLPEVPPTTTEAPPLGPVVLPASSPFTYEGMNTAQQPGGANVFFSDAEGCLVANQEDDVFFTSITPRCGWIQGPPFYTYKPLADSWFSIEFGATGETSCDVEVLAKADEVTTVRPSADCGPVYFDTIWQADNQRTVSEDNGVWTLTVPTCEEGGEGEWFMARIGRPMNEGVLISAIPCFDTAPVVLAAPDLRIIYLVPDEPTGPVLSEAFEELAVRDDLNSTHANILRLYWATFNREPDLGGANFWIDAFNSGEWPTLVRIGEHFAISAEFLETYGDTTNAEYVDLLYQNTLGRGGEPAGRAFWIDELDDGERTRGEVLADFSYSPEFQRNHPLPSDNR